MENWHLDFPEFLDLRQNSGDPYRRTRTANTAVWISDEFMKRVQNDDDWYLFDPLEVADLNELYGKAFSERYAYYVAEAEAGRIRMFKKIGAREQFKAILMSPADHQPPVADLEGHDQQPCAQQQHRHDPPLATSAPRSRLPQDRDNVSVCNLASINLSRHLASTATARSASTGRASTTSAPQRRPPARQPDRHHASRASTRRTTPTSRTAPSAWASWASPTSSSGSASQLRERGGVRPDRRDHGARLLRGHRRSRPTWRRSAARTRTSRARAGRRGSCRSTRSRSPRPTAACPIKVDRTTRLDWDALREKVKGGMRNATLMAIAPTASIGLVAGTTPGLDPQFSQIFSRSTSSGKFLEVNRNLVDDAAGARASGSRCARRSCAVAGRHPGHRRDPGRDQGDVQDELPALAVRVPRGRGPRAEVDRPGDQPQHVPRDARPRRHDGRSTTPRGSGASRRPTTCT